MRLEGMALIRPARLVRITLTILGILFLPIAIWFLTDNRHRYVGQSVGLFIGAVLCFYFAFRRDSWLMTMLEGLDS